MLRRPDVRRGLLAARPDQVLSFDRGMLQDIRRLISGTHEWPLLAAISKQQSFHLLRPPAFVALALDGHRHRPLLANHHD